jgi:hypothetical protein
MLHLVNEERGELACSHSERTLQLDLQSVLLGPAGGQDGLGISLGLPVSFVHHGSQGFPGKRKVKVKEDEGPACPGAEDAVGQHLCRLGQGQGPVLGPQLESEFGKWAPREEEAPLSLGDHLLSLSVRHRSPGDISLTGQWERLKWDTV